MMGLKRAFVQGRSNSKYELLVTKIQRLMFDSEKSELEFYRKLHRRMAATIYTIDIDSFSIEWINENAMLNDVLGLSRDEILRQGPYIASKVLADPDFMETVVMSVERFKKEPGSLWAGVYRIRHKDGHMNWVIYSASILEVDAQGVPAKMVVVAVDPNNILNTPKSLDDFANYIRGLRYSHVREKLTERQNEILKFILSNNSEETIAQKLGISKYTVVDHKKSLFKKLEVKNSKELFAKAEMLGIVR